MPLDKTLLNKLRDHCPAETLRWLKDLDENTTLVTVEDLLDENPPMENYVLIGVLFEICHYRRDEEDPTSKNGAYGSNKKTKKNYNRIFEFGCLSGATFAVICDTEACSQKMMSKHKDIAIGGAFAIWEPKKTKLGSTLRPNMPVLEVGNAFIPFHDTAMAHLPKIVPRNPAIGGEATFFLLHNQQIQFGGCDIRGPQDVYPPSCGGVTCDRSTEQKVSRACGCFRFNDLGRISPIVMEYTVRFFDGTKNVTVTKQRSFRNTRFFVLNVNTAGLKLDLIDDVERIKTIRKKVKALQDFVNNGTNVIKPGFTIAATITRGMVQDYSDPSARVLSNDGTYKFCFILPTEWKIIKDDPVYKNLKFNLQEIIPDEDALASGEGTDLAGNSPNNAIPVSEEEHNAPSGDNREDNDTASV